MFDSSVRRLNVFKAVVESGGVNSAADLLQISQPSVTAHIKALEQRAGTPLFVRQRGRALVRLTSTGEVLYRYACETTLRSKELSKRIVADQAGWSQHITVAAQRVLANNVLPIVIADRLADRPQTRVLLHSETQESVRRLVRSNAVDLAFLFSRDRPAHEPAELVGHLNLAFVASPSHALAGRATIEAADLAHHGFVGGLPESEFFQLIADVMADIRLANCRFVLNVQDSNAVKVAVSKNVGLALTFAAIIQEELARGELVELPVRSDRLRLPVFCVSRPNNPNVSLQRELLQGVRHHLSKLASDSERRVHHGET